MGDVERQWLDGAVTPMFPSMGRMDSGNEMHTRTTFGGRRIYIGENGRDGGMTRCFTAGVHFWEGCLICRKAVRGLRYRVPSLAMSVAGHYWIGIPCRFRLRMHECHTARDQLLHFFNFALSFAIQGGCWCLACYVMHAVNKSCACICFPINMFHCRAAPAISGAEVVHMLGAWMLSLAASHCLALSSGLSAIELHVEVSSKHE
jgi:hypothetical protein